MGSKSSKWLAASLAATALAVVPVGAVARLDYSRNSVDGHYLPSPSLLVPQVNDVSVPAAGSPARITVAAPVAQPASSSTGFSWSDASVGAGVALLLALAGIGIARRRHTSPLMS